MSHGSSHDDLSVVFQRLQSLLLGLGSVEGFLQQLTDLVAESESPRLACGITVRLDGEPATVTSSGDRAGVLDETQYAAGVGPCLHALRTGEIVDLDDLSAGDSSGRWGEYVAVAHGLGLRCSLSLPLTVRGATIGAMNVYGFESARMFTGERRHRLEVIAAQAAGSLQLAVSQARDAELRAQLERALASRTVIDQALGVLMAQQRCTATEAFALLRMRSQSSQRKLRELAADIVTQVSGQPPEAARSFSA